MQKNGKALLNKLKTYLPANLMLCLKQHNLHWKIWYWSKPRYFPDKNKEKNNPDNVLHEKFKMYQFKLNYYSLV